MDTLIHDGWSGVRDRITGRWNSMIQKKRLSFLSIHYLYILGMSLLGSILCVATGMPYIDALFFSVGASTQSGLNTIDVNKLNTFQQIVLYMLGNTTNVVFIHTFVVFVRLYWFEKRFQHVVKEAMNIRRTRSRAVMDFNDLDTEKAQGVNGRSIVMVNNSGRVIGQGDESNTEPESSRGSDQGNQDPFPRLSQDEPAPLQRNITFAENLVSPTGRKIPDDRLPDQRGPEQHIAFLEKQRDRTDQEVLRIPGPRESDRGKMPEAVMRGDPLSPDGNNVERHVTLDASNTATRYRLRTNTSGLHMRHSATQRSQASATGMDRGSGARARRGTGLSTFSDVKSLFTRHDTTGSRAQAAPYLSWQPTIGRNSAFIDLTEEQREELGGIEYRSLKLLAVILVVYFFGWHIFGIISLVPWILKTEPWGSVVDAAGQSRVWWGFFTPATLFNDVGFTLTPDSFLSFQGAVWPLLLGSFLIVIGNTGFPCLLRLIIWISNLVSPTDSAIWEELRFLLDHPRRCFTLLFPSSATWVLFGILVVLNGVDLIFFIILDLNDPVVTNIPPGLRVLAGLFQAVSTRTSGTAVVNLSKLHPGIQVSYLIMMYISVFPIAISVRRTNVYEEKSLGIYGSAAENENGEHEPSYIGAHLRKQLSFDLWFIFLGLFIIAIAEGGPIANDSNISIFAILFEIVSAYGTVGLSLGYGDTNASLSAQFSVVSKLVIIAMMIRGRHRGLPYELDRAILLPSESLHKKEDEDAARRNRRNSGFSEMDIRRAAADGLFDPIITPLIEHNQHQTANKSGVSSPVGVWPDLPTSRQMMGDALASVVRTNSKH